MRYVTIASLFLVGLATVWYLFFSLKPTPLPQEEILARYQYSSNLSPNLRFMIIDDQTSDFVYTNVNDQQVNGRISYPADRTDKMPVLIGVSAMGRSYIRWWVDSFKERPTVTQVNRITEIALSKGYAVISIDARYHGKRKESDHSLQSIMWDLEIFGDRTLYEDMIIGTVIDHRILLDWVHGQPVFDQDNIHVVGYSMGAQISLLLASVDTRVDRVTAIVPPFLDDKLAAVAPKNLVDKLSHTPVFLITADDDENASIEENELLYETISNANKRRKNFQGSHILPDGYTEILREWL